MITTPPANLVFPVAFLCLGLSACRPPSETRPPDWIAIPKNDLSVRLSVDVSAVETRSLLWSGPGLQVSPSGTIVNTGPRDYLVENGYGTVIIRASTQDNTNSMDIPWGFNCTREKSLSQTNPISDLSFISIKMHDQPWVFREPKVLAACSGILAFQTSHKSRRFVAVLHDYVLERTDHGGAGVNYSFAGKQCDFWPYDEAFLASITNSRVKGDPRFEIATSLLSKLRYDALGTPPSGLFTSSAAIHSAACIRNLKQIGIAAAMYKEENKGQLPTDFAHLEPYLILNAPQVVLCPADKERTKLAPTDATQSANRSTFRLNTNLLSYQVVGPGSKTPGARSAFIRCPFHSHYVDLDGRVHPAGEAAP